MSRIWWIGSARKIGGWSGAGYLGGRRIFPRSVIQRLPPMTRAGLEPATYGFEVARYATSVAGADWQTLADRIENNRAVYERASSRQHLHRPGFPSGLRSAVVRHRGYPGAGVRHELSAVKVRLGAWSGFLFSDRNQRCATNGAVGPWADRRWSRDAGTVGDRRPGKQYLANRWCGAWARAQQLHRAAVHQLQPSKRVGHLDRTAHHIRLECAAQSTLDDTGRFRSVESGTRRRAADESHPSVLPQRQ